MPEVFVSRIDDFAEDDRRLVFRGRAGDRRLSRAKERGYDSFGAKKLASVA